MPDLIWEARPNNRVPAAEPGEAWADLAARLGLVECDDGVWRAGGSVSAPTLEALDD